MTPSLLQTQFMKRYISGETKAVPIEGPFCDMDVVRSWFTGFERDGCLLTITPDGVKAFWEGVAVHGHKNVMNRPKEPTRRRGKK